MRTSVQRWLLVSMSAIAGIFAVLLTTPASALFPSDSTAEAEPTPTPTASDSSTPEPQATATKSSTPSATKTKTKSPKPQATKTEAAPSAIAGDMKDGAYTGGSFSAGSYGTVKVKITVSGGQITKVETPSLPSRDRESQRINEQAGPYLRDQALQAQSTNIAGVGGASYTTQAFKKSLQDAINKSKK